MDEMQHIPVLLKECLDGLAIRPDGFYLDGTLGGAGHSSLIASKLTTGHLYGFDQDEDAIKAASERLDEFKDKVHVPIINMVDETVKYCVDSGYSQVGLLCTIGTKNTGLYQKACDRFNLKLIVPDDEEIKALQDMIYSGVKANNFNYDTSNVKQVISTMRNRGAQAFILGCTETPIAVQMYHIEGNFIDSSLVLAHKAIEAVGAPLIKSHAVT